MRTHPNRGGLLNYGTMVLADMGAEVIRVETTQIFPNQTRGVLARPTREMVKHRIATAGG